MEIILFFMMLAVLISMFTVIGKLNRMEYLIRTKLSPPPKQEKLPLSAQEPPKQPAVEQPVIQKKQTVQQAPPVPPKQPEQKQPKQQKQPTAFDNFVTWLWMGNIKGKENVSKEYAIATTWLMRAGVIVLLCGIGFFLKYSIDNNLISPAVRLCLTFLTGIAMFVCGLLMLNKRFHILAMGLLSVGIITLYMGSFAGYKLFHLLPAEAAFGFMVLTTIAAMTVSMKLALLPTALTGCTGAYLTPVLLSDGSGNLPFFLGYTAIISAGLLIVSRERRWRSVEISSFIFSFVLMGYGILHLSHKLNWWCLGFLLLNYLVFSLIPVIRKKEFPAGKTEWLLPIFAAVLTLALGLFITDELITGNEQVQRLGLSGFAVLISAISMCEGLWLNKKQENGAKMLPAFLCASIFALALAVPLALNDNESAIAAAWSVLGFVLVLAAVRSQTRTLLWLSALTYIASFFVVTACFIFSAGFAERFFSGGVFTLSLLGSWFVLRKYQYNESAGKKSAPCGSLFACFNTLYCAAGGLAFLWYTSYEVFHNLKRIESLRYFCHGGLSVWWGILVVALIVYGIRKNLKVPRICGLALFLACLVKVYCIDISGLNTLGKVIAFLLLGVLFLGAATAYILFRKRFSKEEA